MKKQLIVHAGLPKTGTSALQVFFQKQRQNLLERYDLNYIQHGTSLNDAMSGKITSGNAADLAKRMREGGWVADQDGDLESILSYIDKSDNSKYLVSSEFFSGVSSATWRQFRDIVSELGVGVKIAYFVRRQDQFLMSAYMQNVKRHRYEKSISQFVESNYKNNPMLRYFSFAESLEEVFGPGNVTPIVYEQAKEASRGLEGFFFQKLLGEDVSWISITPPVNTSLTPGELKLMMVANQYKPRMRFSDILVEGAAESGKMQLFTTHNIMSPELANEVLRYFSEENVKFLSKYSPEFKFSEEVEHDFVDLDNLSIDSDDLSDVVIRFLVSFDKRISQIESKLNK